MPFRSQDLKSVVKSDFAYFVLIGLSISSCMFMFHKTAESAEIDSFLSDDLLSDIASSEEWLRLLYYGHSWFEGRKGVVDSDGFYLSGSKADAHAELLATLEAFSLSQDEFEDINDHPRCLFPARFRYLKRVAPVYTESLPKLSCPDLEEYVSTWSPRRLTMIFSDYLINNPVSMFGHVFLRFESETKKSRMLDLTVSFAAQPEFSSALYMALTGPFGGMPGLFFAEPYYIKFQQYSNHEGRDLWEYTLNLNSEEVSNVFYSLWEVGRHRIDYFYLDDNCALLLLAVLETARPDIELSRSLRGIVTPVDTVKAVVRNASLIENITYRPSSASRLKQRYSDLEGPLERTAFVSLVELEKQVEDLPQSDSLLSDLQTRLNKILADLDSERVQSEVLDAILEYGDHKYKLALGKTLEEAGAQAYRQLVLVARSRRRHPPRVIERPSDRPDLGHDTFRVGLLGGVQKGSASPELLDQFTLSVRPALRDLKSPAIGYPNNFAIEFFHTEVALEGAALGSADRSSIDVYLKSFTLFETNSRPNLFDPLRSPSWNVKLGYKNLDCVEVGLNYGRCAESVLAFGFGVTWSSSDRPALQLSVLPVRVALGNLHTESVLNGTLFASYQPQLAIGYSPARDLRLSLEGDWALRWLFRDAEAAVQQKLENKAEFTAAYRMTLNQEARLISEVSRHSMRLNIGFFQYL